jgi:hypothetical protein
MAADSEKETAFSPGRRLCPDGSCVGIIGADGKCSVCELVDPDTDNSEHSAQCSSEAIDDEESESTEVRDAEAEEPTSAFDSSRRLCSDGSCIGVIGRSNRCSVCGKLAD